MFRLACESAVVCTAALEVSASLRFLTDPAAASVATRNSSVRAAARACASS